MVLLGWFISSSSFHQSHHAVCTPPWCSPAALDNSQCLLTFFLLQPCLDCGGNPSGAQLGTKTGHAWPFNLSLPSHSSLPSSPASSGQSSQSQSGLLPLSSPWACRVEWFDLLGNSLGFAPGPLPDLASSSQPALVVLPNSPKNSAPAPPPMHSLLVQSPQEDTSVHREKPPDQPHSCSDCTTCAKFQDSLAILQDLMFEVRKEVDDLRFHLEILDKGTQILQLLLSAWLSTLHRTSTQCTSGLSSGLGSGSPNVSSGQCGNGLDFGSSGAYIE